MTERTKPNMILITMDHLGSADIEPYGATDVRTPGVNRLAEEGVHLTQCYSNGPVCTPSRTALLTGLHPARTNTEDLVFGWDETRGLDTKYPSLARVLGDEGYSTGLFGKWHVGFREEFRPLAHGFDEFFGFLDFSIDYHSHRGIDGPPALWDGDRVVDAYGYLTDLITDRSIEFIEKNAKEPFFLFVSYNAPMPPRQRPDNPADVRSRATWFQNDRAEYVEALERADDGVDQILKTLDKLAISSETIVVFTADHGGMTQVANNGNRFHGFGTLWEGGIRVPCIVRWPGKIAPGSVSDQLAIGADIPVSFAHAGGADFPHDPPLDGIDLFRMLASGDSAPDRTFYWRVQYPGRHQRAVRSGRWKYLADAAPGPGAAEFLFDMTVDEIERYDLARERPEVVDRLRDALTDWESTLELRT